jgi:hypothetical protein
MAPHTYWMWWWRCQTDRRPNNLVRNPVVLPLERHSEPTVLREYSRVLWGWIRKTKRVDVNRLSRRRNVGEVKKFRDMVFRNTLLMARGAVDEDIALYTNMYVNPRDRSDSSGPPIPTTHSTRVIRLVEPLGTIPLECTNKIAAVTRVLSANSQVLADHGTRAASCGAEDRCSSFERPRSPPRGTGVPHARYGAEEERGWDTERDASRHEYPCEGYPQKHDYSRFDYPRRNDSRYDYHGWNSEQRWERDRRWENSSLFGVSLA